VLPPEGRVAILLEDDRENRRESLLVPPRADRDAESGGVRVNEGGGAVTPSFNERDLALLGIRNLRDLGGLPTRGGASIAAGRIFRGSAPSRFECHEREAIGRLNLRSVFDLRMTDEELQSSSDRAVLGAQVVHLPLFQTPRPNWIAPADQTPPATARRYFEMLCDGLDSLVRLVTRGADAAPFLICCTAGRDRTGIVVACLLDLLDVPDEEIARDHARSDFFDPESGRAHSATILELLTLVRGHYGSSLQMLVSRGLAESAVEAIRWALLHPAVGKRVPAV